MFKFKRRNRNYFPQLFLVLCLVSCNGLIETELNLEDFVDSEYKYGMSGVLRYSDQYDTLASRVKLSVVGLGQNSEVTHETASPELFKESNSFSELYYTGDKFNTYYSNLSIDTSTYTQLTPGSYSLSSIHSEYGEISAKTTIPQALPELYNIKIDSLLDKQNAIITFSFDDPIEENYYHLSFQSIYEQPILDTFISDLDTLIFPLVHIANIKDVSDSSIEFTHDNDLIFSDQNFNGTTYTLTLNIYVAGNLSSLSFDQIADILHIEWATISRDLYLFETSYANHLNNAFLGDYSEQTVIYSNVEGGIGYLGGMHYRDVPLN